MYSPLDLTPKPVMGMGMEGELQNQQIFPFFFIENPSYIAVLPCSLFNTEMSSDEVEMTVLKDRYSSATISI